MKDLTQGSVTRIILEMAGPIAAGMIFQTLYLLVDLYFVAALGDASLAGVGAAGPALCLAGGGISLQLRLPAGGSPHARRP